jgi:hypothetical protein
LSKNIWRIILYCIFITALPAPSFAAPMTFQLKGTGGNCNGCEWVVAEGEITADTPSKFEAFVAQEDKDNQRHVEFEIDFNSPGGSLAAGIALGEAIRKHKYRTAVAGTAPDGFGWFKRVPGRCASACAISPAAVRSASVSLSPIFSLGTNVLVGRPIAPGRLIFNHAGSDNRMPSGLLWGPKKWDGTHACKQGRTLCSNWACMVATGTETGNSAKSTATRSCAPCARFTASTFAEGCSPEERLSDVLQKMDEPSLSRLVHDHEHHKLYQLIDQAPER